MTVFTRSRSSLALLGCVAALAVHAQGAPTPAAPTALSFAESVLLLTERSDALLGAGRSADAARDQAEALKALALPRVHLDVQGLRYQKTVNVSLGNLRERAQSAAGDVLGGIAGAGVPGVPGAAVGPVIDRVEAALPDMFAPIPDTIGVQSRRSLLHATLSTVVPLYTGGAIDASQAAARSGAQAAQAQTDSVREGLRFALARAYFAQVLTTQTLQVARETLAGFEQHLSNTRAMQAQGQLSQARVLQVVVARDSAQRAVDRAEGEHAAAVQTLQHLLRSAQPIAPTNALFVHSAPLAPVERFLDAAQDQHPLLRQNRALEEAARQGAAVAAAARRPTAYAFGSVNLNRRRELITEPDWIVGIGMRYTLWPQADSGSREAAALARQEAAEAATRETWTQIQTGIHQSWQTTEAARREFLSLASSIAAAQESLRGQEIAFREGVGTASELIDARNALAQARTERAAAAYKYDLALASLLLASGQGASFEDYLLRADQQLTTP